MAVDENQTTTEIPTTQMPQVITSRLIQVIGQEHIPDLLKTIITTTSSPIETTTEDSSQIEQNKLDLIMEKQRQLQQAKNWHKFLTDRANLRQRAMSNAVSKPKGEFL